MRSCFEVLFVDVFVYFLCLLLTPTDETFICGRVLWIRGEFGRGRFRWICGRCGVVGRFRWISVGVIWGPFGR